MKETEEMKAKEMTEESRTAAEAECEGRWLDACKKLGIENNYDAILERARLFFNHSCELVSEDLAPASRSFTNRLLAGILSNCFHYDYTLYEWNGVGFSEETVTGELDCSTQAMWVVDALETYVLTAAARAKVLASDSYVKFRKALIDINYGFNRFSDGAKNESVLKFLSELQDAAQELWADAYIQKNLKMSCPVPRGGGSKKAPKKRHGGGTDRWRKKRDKSCYNR